MLGLDLEIFVEHWHWDGKIEAEQVFGDKFPNMGPRLAPACAPAHQTLMFGQLQDRVSEHLGHDGVLTTLLILHYRLNFFSGDLKVLTSLQL